MAVTTMIEIALAAIIAISILVIVAVVVRHQRTERRRAQAGEIRDDAAEQARAVGRREALADETAARARASAAEADAHAARARGLAHQAEEHRAEAASARGEANQQFERADTVDPDIHQDGTADQDSTGRRGMPRAGRID